MQAESTWFEELWVAPPNQENPYRREYSRREVCVLRDILLGLMTCPDSELTNPWTRSGIDHGVRLSSTFFYHCGPKPGEVDITHAKDPPKNPAKSSERMYGLGLEVKEKYWPEGPLGPQVVVTYLVDIGEKNTGSLVIPRDTAFADQPSADPESLRSLMSLEEYRAAKKHLVDLRPFVVLDA